MQPIKRDRDRIKETGEIFTPNWLCEHMINQIPEDELMNPDRRWIDPTCGDGNFIVCLFERLQRYHPKEHILNNMLFGVDYMEDNVICCLHRLYKSTDIVRADNSEVPPHYLHTDGFKAMYKVDGVLIKHIISADTTMYDMGFDDGNSFSAIFDLTSL